EKNVWKILDIYTEGAAKLLHDKPALLKAQEMLARLPEGYDKDMAKWYVEHFVKYEDLYNTSSDLRNLDRKIAGVGARSVLFGNTRLQLLHIMRTAGMIWPELGIRDTAYGLNETLMRPEKSLAAVKAAGLVE